MDRCPRLTTLYAACSPWRLPSPRRPLARRRSSLCTASPLCRCSPAHRTRRHRSSARSCFDSASHSPRPATTSRSSISAPVTRRRAQTESAAPRLSAPGATRSRSASAFGIRRTAPTEGSTDEGVHRPRTKGSESLIPTKGSGSLIPTKGSESLIRRPRGQSPWSTTGSESLIRPRDQTSWVDPVILPDGKTDGTDVLGRPRLHAGSSGTSRMEERARILSHSRTPPRTGR